MKKGILLTLCSITPLISFTGCGDDEEEQEEITLPKTEELADNSDNSEEEGIMNIFIAPTTDFKYNVSNKTEAEISGVDNISEYLYIPDVAIIKDKSYTITKIGDRAFENHAEILNVEIPSSIKSIGHFAFSNCTGLLGVEIPSTVTSIGTEAFKNCTSLTYVTIQQGVASIGVGAFNGCKNLTTVEIPASVRSLSALAFYNCDSLSSYSVAPGNPNYASANGVLYDKNKAEIISVPSNIKGEIVIPDGITQIAPQTFSNRKKLTNVEISSTVTTIASTAFSGCSGLTHIVIPSNVSEIEDGAFSGCSNLDVEIENPKARFGTYAFEGCKSVSYKK